MKISIIVPAFNEEKILPACLAAIREATTAFRNSAEWELILCNNNSSDRTAEIAQAAGAQVVFEPINQISRARNRGASVGTGDWFLFIDADSFPSAALFAALLLALRNPRCAGGGCLLRFDQTQPMVALFLRAWNTVSRVMHWAAGSFVFCDANLFRELGGFSEQLFASEEIDFCRRLKEAARRQKRALSIITEERLLTSARKMHLYTTAEYFRFMVKAALIPGRILTNREQCGIWYSGRR